MKSSSITPVYNYHIEQEGDYSKITYKRTPVSMGLAGPLCFYIAIPAFILTMIARPDHFGVGLILWFVWLFGLSFGIVLLINYFKKPGEIWIGKINLLVGGKTFDFNHISTILIKDPSGKFVHTSTHIVTYNNSFSVASSIGNIASSVNAMGVRVGMQSKGTWMKLIIESAFGTDQKTLA